MTKVPVPSTLRQVLQLCRFYTSELGLSSLLDHVNWTAAVPAQVYLASLGRLPESRTVAVPGAGYSVRAHFEEVLTSVEFQERIIINVLAAFPEKRRLLFVHIPRAAGTNFEESVAESMPSLHQIMQVCDVVSKPALFEHLRDFAQNIDISNRVLVCGHIPLRWYVDNGIRRYEDQIVSIVRDPIDLIISLANYILTVIRNRDDPTRPDRLIWLSKLGIDDAIAYSSKLDLRGLALRILRHDGLMPRNPISTYLGDGTAESALDLMAVTNIEITDVTRYSAWLQRNWRPAQSARTNASTNFLAKSSLNDDDIAFLRALTSEDTIVYERIMRTLEATKTPSINGLDLWR